MFVRGLYDRTLIPMLEKMAAFTEKRNTIIANNVANVDTPDFKAMDYPMKEFQNLLGSAIRERDQNHPREFHLGESRHVEVGTHGELLLKPVFKQETSQMRRDQNTVDMETTMAEMSKNAMMNNIASTLLRSHFEQFETAIRGRM